ncbi:MAG TPA: alpha/beta fold hydrolase, partial [Thermoanaerobaculia bacterium]|nr:alpha/beta fold hydrolase [Thermoanaerobaculia bacterium]
MRRRLPLVLLAGGAAYGAASWLLSRRVAERLLSSRGLAPLRETREALLAALSDAGAEVVDFRFEGAPRSPVELAAVFASPGAPSTRATIVFLHGKGGGSGEWRTDAVRAVGQGYNVLVPDLRGHSPSGGAFFTFGFLEREDMANAVRRAAERFRVDPSRLGVHSCSAGSSVALEWAARETRIRAIWLESPFADARAMARRYLSKATGIPPALLGLTTSLALRRAVRTVRQRLGLRGEGEGLQELDPIAAARAIRSPIFFVHGRQDGLVPPHFAE